MGATMGKNGTILDSLPSTHGTLHIAMLGLDSAGKTTALYRLKLDQYLNTVTTIGFNCEKVRGSLGKAKGVQFLVWDVGGQEKLRPLWRSYTRCTDGIVFVVDSVDVERMEEAKMELMRTAKCSENHGVPILIFANKQDLPGAKEPKELEKLLGLRELSFSVIPPQMIKSSSTLPVSANISSGHKPVETRLNSLDSKSTDVSSNCSSTPPPHTSSSTSSSTSPHHASSTISSTSSSSTSNANSFKGWYIQPACAITGDGLQEGLEALYDMILKKRKLNKAHKKKRC